ncbi:ZIP zinc transporter-domain-containing protein [Lactifluus volemus]|nr:ZIP zinc transporter-domain-containing protein [Lactifluus volemus]
MLTRSTSTSTSPSLSTSILFSLLFFVFLSGIEIEIAQCPPIRQLSALKEEIAGDESPLLRQVFRLLFPFGPGWNSGERCCDLRTQGFLILAFCGPPPATVLGTFYISSVPNFILAFIPAEINPNTLNTMTAFATGGLLSDVFLHLVPHSFLGEHQDGAVHFVMVEEKRNILVGLGIFIGFAVFFMMEKTLRVLGGGDGHTHSPEGHGNRDKTSDKSASSAIEPNNTTSGLRSRRKVSGEYSNVGERPAEEEKGHISGPSKLSAYLNLFGDFVHNIMTASFYSSPLIGATTTLACFAHEIPHEIADYSILIRSGFTKRQAMRSQFITAIGAFVGTFMGIAIHNLSASGHAEDASPDLAAAVRQTAKDYLVIPFVAGGFLYIGAVAVLPTLLEESKSGKQALREFGAMAFGVLCMFLVAWNE